jgi:transcription elongation factor GreA
MEKLYFTKRGFESLLKKIKRDEEKIQEMSSRLGHLAEVGGDQYHDNFSYEQQTMDLRMLTNKLNEDKKLLNLALIVDEDNFDKNKVSIGTTTTLEIDGKISTWNIVGYGESDPKNKKLAYNTPIGKSILNKSEGDIVNCQISNKNVVIKIVKIG